MRVVFGLHIIFWGLKTGGGTVVDGQPKADLAAMVAHPTV